MNRADEFATRVRERFPEAVTDARVDVGDDVLVVRAQDVHGTLELLRDEFGFALLSDLSAVDWMPREPRFDVNYHLYAFDTNHRLRVKVQIDEGTDLPTVTDIWPTADYHEREVFDFFGITFTGHPNLARLFMPPEWIGHPLRKDYPVGGVPVEYKIEPAYVGEKVVSAESRASAGGTPPRIARDRGLLSRWTWTGHPASGVRIPSEPERPQEPDAESEGRPG